MGGVTSVKLPLTSQLDWLVAERDKTDRREGGERQTDTKDTVE